MWGSYLHGLFEQGAFRQSWLAEIFEFSGDGRDQQQRTLASLDLLADALEQALDVELLSPLLATANMAKQVNQSS